MNSIAAAKRRRAQVDNKPPTPPNAQVTRMPPQPQPVQQRLNPSQIIAQMDSRITSLERQISVPPAIQVEVNTPEGKRQMGIAEYMSEVDQKFLALAEELSTMKETLMKLQSFTMDVNRKMFDKLNDNPASLNINTQQLSPIPEQRVPPSLGVSSKISQDNDNDNDNDDGDVEQELEIVKGKKNKKK